MRKGISLIEVILSIGIIMLLFGGIYTAYIGILDAITNSEIRAVAAKLLNAEIETLRNLPYDSVGVQGGFPSGVLTAEKAVVAPTGEQFIVHTTVRNIDDPFDGTIGGVPNDTAPADYKLVELEASCISCVNFVPLLLTTTIAPKGLESALTGGSLFINVFDASAQPIQNATVHVVNTSVSPAIDLTDVTNVSGVLQLVGVPTSTQGYEITVTKPGHSSAATYPIGAVGNPNPVLPHATVAANTLTEISFAIDKTSTVIVATKDFLCAPVPNASITLSGAKKIGTNPDVLKFSTTTATDASGVRTFSGIEWDSYTLAFTGAGYDVQGTMPLMPFVVNPSSTVNADIILTPATIRSVRAIVLDGATGLGIPNASVRLENGAGYDATNIAGRATVTETTWTGGAYIAQSGGMDTESVPGSVELAGPSYPTSTEQWLISKTIDAGTTSVTYHTFSFDGASNGQVMRFQLAANNDNTTWQYVGPDGTSASYFTVSDTAIPAGISGNRYMRYKVYMETTNENVTPALHAVHIELSGSCIPPYEAYFGSIASGTYTLTATASGYAAATSSIDVLSGATSTILLLTP